MDFHGLNRKSLQQLCKKHGIPANLKNVEMADRLSSLLPKAVKRGKSCLKSMNEVIEVGDDEEVVVVESKEVKKVRFSPENQTFLFERTDPRAMRLLGRKKRAFGNSREEENLDAVSRNLDNVGRVEEHMGRRNVRRESVVISEGVGSVSENDENGEKLGVEGGELERNLRPQKGKGKLDSQEVISLLSPSGVDKVENLGKGRNLRRSSRRSLVQVEDLRLVSENVDEVKKLPVNSGKQESQEVISLVSPSGVNKGDNVVKGIQVEDLNLVSENVDEVKKLPVKRGKQRSPEVISLVSPCGVSKVENAVKGRNLRRSLRRSVFPAEELGLVSENVDYVEASVTARRIMDMKLRSEEGKSKDNGAGVVQVMSPCNENEAKTGKQIVDEGVDERVDRPSNEMVDHGGNDRKVTRRQLKKEVASDDLSEGDISISKNPKNRDELRKSMRSVKTVMANTSFITEEVYNISQDEDAVESLAHHSLEIILENKGRKSGRRKIMIVKRQDITKDGTKKTDKVGAGQLPEMDEQYQATEEKKAKKGRKGIMEGSDEIFDHGGNDRMVTGRQLRSNEVASMDLERDDSDSKNLNKGVWSRKSRRLAEKAKAISHTSSSEGKESNSSPNEDVVEGLTHHSREMILGNKSKKGGRRKTLMLKRQDITEDSTKKPDDVGADNLPEPSWPEIDGQYQATEDPFPMEPKATSFDKATSQSSPSSSQQLSMACDSLKLDVCKELKGVTVKSLEIEEVNVQTPSIVESPILSLLENGGDRGPNKVQECLDSVRNDENAPPPSTLINGTPKSPSLCSISARNFTDASGGEKLNGGVRVSEQSSREENQPEESSSVIKKDENAVSNKINVADHNDLQSGYDKNEFDHELVALLLTQGCEGNTCSVENSDTAETDNVSSEDVVLGDCIPVETQSKILEMEEKYHAIRDSFLVQQKAEFFSEAVPLSSGRLQKLCVVYNTMPLADFREKKSSIKEVVESAELNVQTMANDDTSTHILQSNNDSGANKVQEIPFKLLDCTFQEENATPPLILSNDIPSLRSMEARYDTSILEQLKQANNSKDFESSLQHMLSEDGIFNSDESKGLEYERDDSAEKFQDKRSMADDSLCEQEADNSDRLVMDFTKACSVSVSWELEIAGVTEPNLATGDSIQLEQSIQNIDEATQHSPFSSLQLNLAYDTTQSELCCEEEGTNETTSCRAEQNSLTPAKENALTPVMQKSGNFPSLRSMEEQYDESPIEKLEQASSDRTFEFNLQHFLSEGCEEKGINEMTSENAQLIFLTPAEEYALTPSVIQKSGNVSSWRSMKVQYDKSTIKHSEQSSIDRTFGSSLRFSENDILDTDQSEGSNSENYDGSEDLQDMRWQVAETKVGSLLNENQSLDNIDSENEQKAVHLVNEVSEAREFSLKTRDSKSTKEFALGSSTPKFCPSDVKETVVSEHYHGTEDSIQLEHKEYFENATQLSPKGSVQLFVGHDMMLSKICSEGNQTLEKIFERAEVNSQTSAETDSSLPFVMQNSDNGENVQEIPLKMLDVADCTFQKVSATVALSISKDSPSLKSMEEQYDNSTNCKDFASSLQQLLSVDGIFKAGESKGLECDSEQAGETIVEASFSEQVADDNERQIIYFSEACSFSVSREQGLACKTEPYLATGDSIQMKQSVEKIKEVTQFSPSSSLQLNLAREKTQSEECCEEKGANETISENAQLNSLTLEKEYALMPSVMQKSDNVPSLRSMEVQYDKSIIEHLDHSNNGRTFEFNLQHLFSEDCKEKGTIETTLSEEGCEVKGINGMTSENAKLNFPTPGKDNALTLSVIEINDNVLSLRSTKVQYDKPIIKQLEQLSIDRTFRSSLKYLFSEDEVLFTEEKKGANSEVDDGVKDLLASRSVMQVEESKFEGLLSEREADNDEGRSTDSVDANNEQMVVQLVNEGSEARESTPLSNGFSSGDSIVECSSSVSKEPAVAEHYHATGDSIQSEHKEMFEEATHLSTKGSVQLCVSQDMMQSEICSEAKGSLEKIFERAEVNYETSAKNDCLLPSVMQNCVNGENIDEIPLEMVDVKDNNSKTDKISALPIVLGETNNGTSFSSIVVQNRLDTGLPFDCSSASQTIRANCEALNLTELEGLMMENETFESNVGLVMTPDSENEMDDTRLNSAPLTDDNLTVQLTEKVFDSISSESGESKQLDGLMSIEKVVAAGESSVDGSVQSLSTVKGLKDMETVTSLKDGAADCSSKRPRLESDLSVKISFFLQPEVVGELAPISGSMDDEGETSKWTTKGDIACSKNTSTVEYLALVDRPTFKLTEEADNSVQPNVKDLVSDDNLISFDKEKGLKSEKALTVTEYNFVDLGENKGGSGSSQNKKLGVNLDSFITDLMPKDIGVVFQAAKSVPYTPQEEINHVFDDLCDTFMAQHDQENKGNLMTHHEETLEAFLSDMNDSITSQNHDEFSFGKSVQGNCVVDIAENIVLAMEESHTFGGTEMKAGEIDEFPEGLANIKGSVVADHEIGVLIDGSGNKLSAVAESDITDSRMTQQNVNENHVVDQAHTVQVDACNIANPPLASEQSRDLENLPHYSNEDLNDDSYIPDEKSLNSSQARRQYIKDQRSSHSWQGTIKEEYTDNHKYLTPDVDITGPDLVLERVDNPPTSLCGEIGLDLDKTDAQNDDASNNLLLKRQNRSVLIQGTPRKPLLPKNDMKENMVSHKRSQIANATATKPVFKRKPLGNI